MRSESEIGQKSAMSEQLKAQVEDLKLQLSQNDSKLAEYQTERVKSLEKKNQRNNLIIKKTLETKFYREKSSFEKQILDQQKEIDELTIEKQALDKEYGAYKTRVHSVLKQQKEQRTDPAQLEQVILRKFLI